MAASGHYSCVVTILPHSLLFAAQSNQRVAPPAEAKVNPDIADMKLVCANNESAFQRIVERYQQRILAYCFRITGERVDAQDIGQDVFLTLWLQRKRYREEGKLNLYLLKIARLRSLALLKKRRSRTRLAEKVRKEGTHRHAKLPLSLEADHLHLALSKIRVQHRDILTLRHFEELSLEEIRTLTGLRIGTIKSRLHRGLVALRKEIDDVG